MAHARQHKRQGQPLAFRPSREDQWYRGPRCDLNMPVVGSGLVLASHMMQSQLCVQPVRLGGGAIGGTGIEGTGPAAATAAVRSYSIPMGTLPFASVDSTSTMFRDTIFKVLPKMISTTGVVVCAVLCVAGNVDTARCTTYCTVLC